MKKLISSVIIVLITIAVNAQSEKFISAMKKNIALMDSAMSKAKINSENLLSTSANFERIGTAEKTQWLPFYYAAYTQIQIGFMAKPTDYEIYAKKAEALLEKADALEKDNSELHVLKAMNNTLFMMVNPMQRFIEYGGKISANLAAAQKADSTNPRRYMFEAMSTSQTPEQFGGGCKNALPLFAKANTLFLGFKPKSDIHPKWGAPYCLIATNNCKK